MSGKRLSGKQCSISTFFKKQEKRPLQEQRLENNKKARKGEYDVLAGGLSPEQKAVIESKRSAALAKLHRREMDVMGESWATALKSEFEKPYFVKLKNFITVERKSKVVFPPEDEVFSWTRCFDIKDTKVVILGQDPYHGPGQAHGLCFSVKKGVAAPPSLVNMYKELSTDVPGFKKPDHGYLMGWASQGVLLLNAVLTVVHAQANSHKDQGWEKFTDATVEWINSNLSGVVFMLWGGYAQKKGKTINQNRHLVLKAVHPSPLSAYRGFIGCRHFSKANAYLTKAGKEGIDWNHLP